jgi:hypothetical protein
MPKIKQILNFKAEIYTVGVNRCVDVPERITRELGQEKHIPVKGKVENIVFRSNLVPRGNGKHRLFIHSSIWRRLDVDIGDIVSISLQHDTESREVSIPADIMSALRGNSEALSAFEAMTINGRRAFVRWISEAKLADTRANRIQIGLERLIENRRKSRRKKS